MKVGFYQFAPVFGRMQQNLEKISTALNGAQADLIVIPELPFTGYSFRDRAELSSFAEEPGSSETVQTLIELCKTNDLHLVTGFAEKAGDKIFNSSLLIGPEGLQQTYRKMHLFNTEKEYFDPGDTPLEVAEVRGVKVGMMICFDWVFPEAARILALKGADLICHPSNLVLALCPEAMITRCTENSVFAVTANRFGIETRDHGSLTFSGLSQLAAPKGKLVYRTGAETEELWIGEIDVAAARNKQLTPRNDLFGDRRPEFYAPLLENGS